MGSAGAVGTHDTAAVKGPGIVVGRKGSIGDVTWVERDFWPIDTTYFVEAVDDHDLRWIYHLLQHENLAALNRATGVPGLNRDDVYALTRPIPDPVEAQLVAKVLDSIEAAIEQTEAVIEQTERLRATLCDALVHPRQGCEMQLGEALERIIDHRGQTAKKLGGEFQATGIPVISAVSVRNGSIQIGPEPRCVSRELYLKWMSTPLASGDVILTSEAPLGAPALLRERWEYCLGQRLFALRPRAGVLDSRYLYYWLNTRATQAELARRSTGTTATGIRQVELAKIPIVLPDIKEQGTLGECLASLDERTADELRVLDALRVLKASVADALLSGRVRVRMPEEVAT